MSGLKARADLARTAHAGYLRTLEDKYQHRKAWREQFRIPALGIGGMGRAGKDTAAEFLCACTKMIYPGSASQMILPLLTNMVYDDNRDVLEESRPSIEQKVFDDRHSHREFWIAACHALRGNDYGLLVRMCLGAGDIAVGIRGRLELETVLRDQIITTAMWIDNPRVPHDITVEYGPEDCDVMIPNYGSVLELYAKLRKWLYCAQYGAFTTKGV